MPISLAYCMHVLPARNEPYEFGQLGTELSWFRYYTVPKANELYFLLLHERRTSVTATVVSPIFPYLISLPLVLGLAYSTLFFPAKTTLSRKGTEFCW